MSISKRTFIAIAVVAGAMGWFGYTQLGTPGGSDANVGITQPVAQASAPGPATLNDYLSSFIVDKNQSIALKHTRLGDGPSEATPGPLDNAAVGVVNRGTADYFRYLQTQFQTGATLQANTEAIRQHLMETLPKADADRLFALYEKFLSFELTVSGKTKNWEMPQSPSETLALITKMQQLQQETFGAEDADMLFGGELKGMEYTARSSAIYNDRVAGGAEKEALLKKLATDMFGAEGAKIDEKKNPYNLFEEKLLIYKNDLDKLEPPEQEKLIQGLRAKYLPPSAQ